MAGLSWKKEVYSGSTAHTKQMEMNVNKAHMSAAVSDRWSEAHQEMSLQSVSVSRWIDGGLIHQSMPQFPR